MVIDFIIGLTLINAIPHFILGIWKGRMISGLGFGNTANILYGLTNFLVSVSLFLYKYGLEGILENGIYLGGLSISVFYFIISNLCYTCFHKKHYEK